MNMKQDHAHYPMYVEDLKFAYHRRNYVIQNVQGGFEKGKIHAIIGPNAAGKSTFLKLLMNHIRPSGGRVYLNGKKIRRVAAYQRAGWMSYVPQRTTVSFSYRVEEMIRMGRFALTENEHAIREAVRHCDLEDLLDQPFDELSVGQQQRIMLARAMVQSAGQGKIMLLDEPTSAMDLHHIHDTMKHLQTLAGEGLAIVMVLHDLNLVAKYADTVWLLDKGKLIARGDYATVLTPSILEPVYGVRIRKLRRVSEEGSESKRPLFDVDLPED